MPEAVIVSAVRTPVGKLMEVLAPLKAMELGSLMVREAIRRADLNLDEVDEVIMGNVVSAGLGQNPARQAAIEAGILPSVPAFTVNKVCGSGMKAVILAAQAIRLGDAQIIVAGGMESLSNAPHLLYGGRAGLKYGEQKLVDAAIRDGLWCAFEDWHMGCAAEYIAQKYNISREEQDAFALESHRRAVAATREGRFKAEILPVEVPNGRGTCVLVEIDESPRTDTSMEKLRILSPVFEKNGTVTAGNSPGMNDGAAAVVVMSDSVAAKRSLKPFARIVAYTSVGVEPRDIFIAPALATRQILKKANLKLEDMDAIEMNEAFAAQMLACKRELNWDDSKVNVHGGAVALGHPLAASGARVLVTLLYVLEEKNGRYGLATLCLGGGNAVAMIVERNWKSSNIEEDIIA
ncbi:acetyl-CoA C-acetyltransferase [Candidatus Acetothermia bacterium]|nr:acetyl-CoA C-acetyltransferase [Candidatus Acetothermia bacterium]